MDSKQLKALGNDMQAAVAGVLLKHGINAPVTPAIDSKGNFVIVIGLPTMAAAGDAKPTLNAVARYKKFGAKLGLPERNTVLAVGGKNYALVGLSTDGARVKAIPQQGGTVVDLPLAAVQAATTAAGAKIVADMDKAEQAQPDDVIDPSVASLLGGLAKKEAPKPAEGQQ